MPVGELAAALAEATGKGDLLFVALDEQRAKAVAAALAALAPGARVVHLPSSDALPGDEAPASPGNSGRRIAALRRLRLLADETAPVVLVTTAEATAMRYPAPDRFDTAPPVHAVGEPLDLDAFAARAVEIGYFVDDRIDEPGEVAVRGQVVDIFPVDRDGPVRIEVADGTVAAIRAYDPVTQRSLEQVDRIEIGRATEPAAKGGVSLLEHLRDAGVAADPGAANRRDRFLKLVDDSLRRRGAADDTVVGGKEWAKVADARRQVTLDRTGDEAPPRFVESRNPARAFAAFAKKLGDRRLVLVGSRRDLRFLAPRVAKSAKMTLEEVASWDAVLAAPVGATLELAAPIERGFGRDGVVAVAAADLLGGRAGGAAAASTLDPLLGDTGNLRPGDVVVHEDFGIGVVEGLEVVPDGAGATGGDAIELRYAKGGKHLVPVTEADRIWRYGADEDAVTLDALDGSSWQKRRGAIDAAIAESARGLAALAAERDARRTDPVVPDTAAYERFAAGFPFTETADQARAIAAVRDDLASGKPMDRLVVGDVGYGKTEVALRAAALAALAGRQVAVAAPTTVLVRQHLETFRRRFEGTGVEVAGLSRLSDAAEKKRVIAGLADGTIGVVIGTGAVAGKTAEYKDLALVVIDEEQRFGAADKTKLRELGAGHVLTLSATPIPRTLQSALVGLQAVSVIATPPARRQPIRTGVATFDDAAVRSALMREWGRGGQSFVVVPRIEDMAPLAETLGRLVPELSVVEAHGKLAAADLDEAMVAFADGAGDVLLATNIIEAGLDVPRANTMIVHHADRFGLSQLHQLRGRVGRGGRRGQILLLTDAEAQIAEATLKRLRTLQAFDRLGAGFAISARDLDMRGAGDLMSDAQSGHMKLIGIDLYQHLLGLALRQARGETVDEWVPDLNLELSGRLPEHWIPEAEVRLSLYARLARITAEGALDAFEEELGDRFGAMPDDARRLLDLARIRVRARGANVSRIDAGPAAIALTPRGKADAPKVDGLSEKNGRWIAAERIEDARERAERVTELLGEIGG